MPWLGGAASIWSSPSGRQSRSPRLLPEQPLAFPPVKVEPAELVGGRLWLERVGRCGDGSLEEQIE
jgi:hypothetical protein